MKLKVFDRLILLNILPKEGDIFTLKLIRKLREALSFNENEHQALQFKQGGDKYTDESGNEVAVPIGTIHWNSEADIDKEFNIGPKAKEIIVKVFKELSEKKPPVMNEIQLNVYLKFVDEDDVSIEE